MHIDMRFLLVLTPLFLFFLITRNLNHIEDNVDVKFIMNDDIVEFEIINNTLDTLYLFDSYILDKQYFCKYLNRYQEKDKQCKLSFLPLLPYLGMTTNDLLVIGEKRVVTFGQILYHFESIPPLDHIKIKIPIKVLEQVKYVKDIDVKQYSKFESHIHFEDVLGVSCNNVIVEFALYTNIDLLNSLNAYCCQEIDFNEQALSYKTLSITIPLYDMYKEL